jgi:hypothetical protein
MMICPKLTSVRASPSHLTSHRFEELQYSSSIYPLSARSTSGAATQGLQGTSPHPYRPARLYRDIIKQDLTIQGVDRTEGAEMSPIEREAVEYELQREVAGQPEDGPGYMFGA